MRLSLTIHSCESSTKPCVSAEGSYCKVKLSSISTFHKKGDIVRYFETVFMPNFRETILSERKLLINGMYNLGHCLSMRPLMMARYHAPQMRQQYQDIFLIHIYFV